MTQSTTQRTTSLYLSHQGKTERVRGHLEGLKAYGTGRSDEWIREQWLKELGCFDEVKRYEHDLAFLRGIST